MKKTAEAVSLGHPDKTADFISSFILDKLIQQDAHTRYALEVMLKDNTIVCGGEITTNAKLDDLNVWIREALAQIGYDEKYSNSARFKKEIESLKNTLPNPNKSLILIRKSDTEKVLRVSVSTGNNKLNREVMDTIKKLLNAE